jgi:phosphoribosylanthranilate isomerase
MALAGGLDPRNVGEAIGITGADFVDVSSGVESAPGVKDAAKSPPFATRCGRRVKPTAHSGIRI